MAEAELRLARTRLEAEAEAEDLEAAGLGHARRLRAFVDVSEDGCVGDSEEVGHDTGIKCDAEEGHFGGKLRLDGLGQAAFGLEGYFQAVLWEF